MLAVSTHVREPRPLIMDSRTDRLSVLYESHAPDAKKLAYLLTGDRDLAEDLVHEAFVRVGSRLRSLRDAAAFPAYLKRTIVNLARMHYRHSQVERAFVSRQSIVPQQADAQTSIEERTALRSVLLALPLRQRAAVVLRYYGDLSEAQVADILDCPIGTVKTLVRRGLQSLQEHLGGDWDEA